MIMASGKSWYCSPNNNNNNIILVNYYNMMMQCKHLLPKDWGQRRCTLGEDKISPAFLPTTSTSPIFDFFVSLIVFCIFCLTLGGRCCRRQLLLLSVLMMTLAYSCLLFICIFIILYYVLYNLLDWTLSCQSCFTQNIKTSIFFYFGKVGLENKGWFWVILPCVFWKIITLLPM